MALNSGPAMSKLCDFGQLSAPLSPLRDNPETSWMILFFFGHFCTFLGDNEKRNNFSERKIKGIKRN